MKIRTLIADDEPMALEKLRNYVEKTPFLELTAACTNGFEALETLTAENVDLIITDIAMPDLNGLELMKSLQHPPLVIFTTAYDNYAVDSYRLSAVDYLLKPYTFVDFQRAVNKAREIYTARHQAASSGAKTPDSIFIKVDYRYIRVTLADISYIKGYGEYLQIYLQGRPTPLLTLSSFAAIKEKLPDSFLQVHRSFIVNMDHADTIERSRILIGESTSIPVGDSYKTALLTYISAHSPSK